jgi:hypothetical protein
LKNLYPKIQIVPVETDNYQIGQLEGSESVDGFNKHCEGKKTGSEDMNT